MVDYIMSSVFSVYFTINNNIITIVVSIEKHWEMVQLVNFLPSKHEDLSLAPKTPVKAKYIGLCLWSQCSGREIQEDP